MKQHLSYMAILCLCLSACGPVYVVQQDPAPPPPAGPSEELTYQSFYDQLSPYGQWLDDPNYGYVWQPDAGQGFKPYATNGNWVYTDEGWTWDSGYPWGWAAFHYGRWYFQDGYGWMWIPGSEWAPAWVSWRNSDEYYGWAPLGPNISYNVVVGGGYNPPPQYWSFVPHTYMGSPQIRNYYVRETENVTIINRTTIIAARRSNYGSGPDPAEVGRYTRTPVRPVTIRDSRNPGSQTGNNGSAQGGGSLNLYRPRINQQAGDQHTGGNGRPAAAPSRYRTIPPANQTMSRPANQPSNQPLNGPVTQPPSHPAVPIGRPVEQVAQPSRQPGQPSVQPGQPSRQPGQPSGQGNAPGQPYNRGNMPGQPVQPGQSSGQGNTPAQPGQPAGRPNRTIPPANPPSRTPLPVNQPVRGGTTVTLPNRTGAPAGSPSRIVTPAGQPIRAFVPPKPAPTPAPQPPKPKPQDPKQE